MILVLCENSIKWCVITLCIAINHALPYQHTFRIQNEMHINSFFEIFEPLQCIPIALHCIVRQIPCAPFFEIFGRFQVQSTRFNKWIWMWSLNKSPMICFDLNRSITRHISFESSSHWWPFTSLQSTTFTLFVNWLLLIIWLIDDDTAVCWTPIMGFNNYIQILGYTFVNNTYLHFQAN